MTACNSTRVISPVCHLLSESHTYCTHIKILFIPEGVPGRINVRPKHISVRPKHIFYRGCEDGRPLVSSRAQHVTRISINAWVCDLPSRSEAPNCDRECSDCFKLLLLTYSAEKTAGRHSGSVLPTRFSRWTLKSPTKGLINSKNGWRLSSAELTWHLPQSRIDGANANTTATHRQKNWTPMLFF